MLSKLFKNWILARPYVVEALKEAERQGGIKAFPLAEKDILETMADDLDKRAEELAKKKLNDLLSPVDLTKIVSKDKFGQIYIGGKKPEEGKLANLKAEAEFIVNSEMWDLLINTPKFLAERAMFVEGENLVKQIDKGRSILYVVSNQQNIADLFLGVKSG